eukprot:m51a1_g3328 putative phosphomannomutase a1 (243) ;mRNA; r:368010-369163
MAAKPLVLFDVDGTLTKPRNAATPEMKAFLHELSQKATVAIVGGSDLPKIKEQMGEDVFGIAEYVFAENGLNAYHNGNLLATASIKEFLGEQRLKEFLNFCLHYIADLDIPIKRGTFIELRNGMLNVSPIGRNCSQKEREEFFEYDKVHQVRKKFVSDLEARFGNFGLKFSVGGQISFDVFPLGWDKTYCLRFLDAFPNIYFFGDRTEPGGNDHEISVSPRVKSYTVKGPDHTVQLLRELLW